MASDFSIQRRPIAKGKIKGGEQLSSLITKIYKARGITDIKQVEYRLQNLQLSTQLNGLATAIELIAKALEQQRRIVIVGDFDADGATATALVIRCLRAFGAKHLDFIVPNRFDYGYGLSEPLVDELQQIQAELLITVDNGISSHQGVAKAKQLGMSVIITDHHLPSEKLPEADAIVNPNVANNSPEYGEQNQLHNLAGVGVAFYLMASLKTALKQHPDFQAQAEATDIAAHLDLVALGTVADVVKLDQNNRILVQAGLNRIRHNRCSQGIRALLQQANRDFRHLDCNDLGFALAPRLNAAGRLQDMSIGIDLLLTDDVATARKLAQQLDQINQQRQQIQADMQIFADSVVKSLVVQDSLPAGLCLYHKNWHQGIVGLLASRVKEAINRPTIAFAPADASCQQLKGSARSVAGFHIRDALVKIDQQHPKLIAKFGGHAMAAGLTIAEADKSKFQQLFAQQVEQWQTKQPPQKTITTDGKLDTEDLSLHTAEQIQQAGPWGEGFPEPLFDGYFIIEQKQPIGKGHSKLILKSENSSQELIKKIEAIAFALSPDRFPKIGKRVRITYQLEINRFRNQTKLQLLIKQIL